MSPSIFHMWALAGNGGQVHPACLCSPLHGILISTKWRPQPLFYVVRDTQRQVFAGTVAIIGRSGNPCIHSRLVALTPKLSALKSKSNRFCAPGQVRTDMRNDYRQEILSLRPQGQSGCERAEPIQLKMRLIDCYRSRASLERCLLPLISIPQLVMTQNKNL